MNDMSLPDYKTWEEAQIAAGVDECERSARWWDLLADDEIDRKSWDMYASESRAATYRRTAKSLRLESTTGVPHCVCCLKPTKPISQCLRNPTKRQGPAYRRS